MEVISDIKKAAKALKEGKLVAFPTETVYGLGANGLDPKAVAKIFKAKGRPQDNPLILHIAEKKDILRLVKEVPEKAKKLIDAFWPGPLTIIFKKSDIVPDVITAGLDSVAIRMPSNDIALELIKESEVPVAAPSANLSGSPSPTSAEHVIQDLNIDYVIDGGRTEIGLESTVVDLTVEPPRLLRPGKITIKEMEKVIGKVEINKNNTVAKSPGMKYRHYSPKAKVILVEDRKENIQKLADKYKHLKVGIMHVDNNEYKADVVIHIGKHVDDIARNLFDTLRRFDNEKVDVIIAQGVEDDEVGMAVMNRLRKASIN